MTSADRDGLALDAQQPLDDALRSLVASFAEVLIADDAIATLTIGGAGHSPHLTHPDALVAVVEAFARS